MQYLTVEPSHRFEGHVDVVYRVEAAPDPNQFFSAGSDGFIARWDARTGENLGALMRGSRPVYALLTVQEEGLLAIGQNDGGMHLVNLDANQLERSVQVHTEAVFDFAWLPQRLLVAAAGDGSLTLWQPGEWRCLHQQTLSTQRLRCLALSPDKRWLAVGGSDWQIRLLEVASMRQVAAWQGHDNSVFTLAWHPTQPWLLSGGRDARLKAWQLDALPAPSEKPPCLFNIPAHTLALNHLCFSPDGHWLATASMDKTLKIWNAQTLKLLKVVDRRRHTAHTSSVNRALWLPESNGLITCSDDRQVLGWQLHFMPEAFL